jgi:TolA-binding protein
MSPRDPFSVDPEDLGVRARRGLLSRTEQRELERATDASASLRIAYEVGRDLDGMTAVRGGDDALIANAANAALARVNDGLDADGASRVKYELDARGAAPGGTQRSLRPRRNWSAAAMVALGVLAAGGAAAALWTGVVAWPSAGDKSAPPSAARSPARSVRVSTPAPVQSPATPVAPSPAPAAVTPVAEPQSAARAHRKSAAELFHAANTARRDAAFTRAADLYAELRSTYPNSAESELARVSLGQLLLARGDARGAEREFRRYLARDQGQLVEEALLGRAQSLERLGRTREERASLRRLLEEFPHSVYAARARVRLRALEQDSPPTAR